MELQNLPWYAQMGVFLLIGGIAFGIFYSMYYSNGQSEIESLTTEIGTLTEEVNKLEQKKKNVEKMKKEVQDLRAVLEKVKEILPEKKEVSQHIKKIQAIISTARLKINSWNSLSESKKQDYTEIPFAISLDGNYHNLAMFFDQLARIKIIFTVDGVSIRPAGGKVTRAYSVNATFTAFTYIFSNLGGKQ